MKQFFDYIDYNSFGIFMFVVLVFLVGLFIILEVQLAKTDVFNLEKSCFEFYNKNDYILEECLKYEDKLKESD